jgi:hypothetical protein
VGPQAPPARRSAKLLAVAAQRAGPSCGLPGQSAPTESRGNHLNQGPVLNSAKGPVPDVG